MNGIKLAKHILRIDGSDEHGLPCWGCEERDDDGRFQPHGSDCPKSLVAEAKRVLREAKAEAIKGATP